MSAWGQVLVGQPVSPTFDSPKVGKSEAPLGNARRGAFFSLKKRTKRTYRRVGRGSFFARSGDIFDGRVVTFLTAVRIGFSSKG
jgi:hypothetical protein